MTPNTHMAYALLSTVHTALVVIRASDSPRESLQRAVELGKKAVALDGSTSIGHISLVFAYIFLREFDKAISEAEKAVSLVPNSAAAYWALATASPSEKTSRKYPPFPKSLHLSPIPVHSQVLGALATAYSSSTNMKKQEPRIRRYSNSMARPLNGPRGLTIHYARKMDREKEARAEGAEVLR